MTQKSREALIELLFLSLYLDGSVSEAEDGVLTEALDVLGWESLTPREDFIQGAFKLAKDLEGDVIKADQFQADRAEIIKQSGDEGEGLTWLYRVLGADGVMPDEKRFLEQIEARLYPAG